MDADLVIAGAGAAGLSALWFAMDAADRAGRRRRIVVVDRDLTPGDDRTWAFWGTSQAPFAGVADRTWTRLLVRFPTWEAVHALTGRAYHRVRRLDYDTHILERAARHPDVELLTAEILDLCDEPGGGAVETTQGTLRAPAVFQSARLSPRDLAAPVRHPLRQHFGGWEVRTERPVFDPDVVTFMDFDTDQHDGIGPAPAFLYVLPDAVDRALVEHTVFSPAPAAPSFYDDHVWDHLDALGAGEVTVNRREYGAIPMEDRQLHQRWGRHLWSIGTVGGMTKPTTGYTFQRIHAQTRHLVSTWAATGTPEALPAPPTRFRWTDRMLLHVLHHDPSRARSVFETLFRTTPLDDVLTFLDEASTVGDDLRLMARMPWVPFIRAGLAEAGADAADQVRRWTAGRG